MLKNGLRRRPGMEGLSFPAAVRGKHENWSASDEDGFEELDGSSNEERASGKLSPSGGEGGAPLAAAVEGSKGPGVESKEPLALLSLSRIRLGDDLKPFFTPQGGRWKASFLAERLRVACSGRMWRVTRTKRASRPRP